MGRLAEARRQKASSPKAAILQHALTEHRADGEIVFDVTAGTFSIMKAAQAVGRKFLGCEILSRKTIEGIERMIDPTLPDETTARWIATGI